MKFCLITPTIGRSSLVKTVESVDAQSHTDWEHILMFDGGIDEIPSSMDKFEDSENRYIFTTGEKCNDYGHTPRAMAHDYVADDVDYIAYIDDDDILLPDYFAELERALSALPELPMFAIFPALRMGKIFMPERPAIGAIMSCQYVHRPFDAEGIPVKFSAGGYNHDGEWIVEMTNLYGFTNLDTPPLVSVDCVGRGEFK